MSANADVLRGAAVIGSLTREASLAVEAPCEADVWNPRDFAREQIRGLVRQVFFAGGPRPVKQVVFCAAEPQIDLATVCDQVARALALETRSPVALVDRHRHPQEIKLVPAYSKGPASIKSCSTQMATNLWRVRKSDLGESGNQSGTGMQWLSCLLELRTEFEYVVIQGPVAAISSEAALLGQLTDGLILVLGAHSTRRATARKIKEILERSQSRILGTVLSERRFPIPERIYSRL